MAGIHGADVEQLRALAQRAAKAAGELRSAATTVATQVEQSPWRGPDASRFRSDWSSRHAPGLAGLAGALDEASRTLVAQAADQERTSTDDGGGTGGPGQSGGTDDGRGSVFAGAHASAATGSAGPPAGADPAEVTAWWNGLSESQRDALLAAQPGVIGNLDGIPAHVRDAANRAYLEQEIARVQASPGLPDRNAAAEKARTMNALLSIQATLDQTPGAHLLLLDTQTGSTVHTAIALGDVDAADHVAVFTQGMDSSTEKIGGVSNPVHEIAMLKTATDSLLYQRGDDSTTAMVVWMGYDAPQGLFQAALPGYGETGAPALASFADGIRSTNPDAHLTALGHSYGSYVTGASLKLTDSFDDAVVFGSPGVTAGSVDELRTGSGELYVLEAKDDPVADLGRFGPDPNLIGGVTDLSSEPHGEYVGSTGHSEYLKDQSTSQHNMAAVVSGHPEDAVRGPNVGAGDVVRILIGGLL
jgi:uncharacterized protein YukE